MLIQLWVKNPGSQKTPVWLKETSPHPPVFFRGFLFDPQPYWKEGRKASEANS